MPGQEEICDFVNTLDAESGRDVLADWLRERGLRATRQRVRRAAGLREALRALLLANNGVETDTAAAEAAVEEAARRARLAVRFGPARLEPAATAALDRVLGEVVAAVARAAADGSWPRLKACRGERCGWAFVDRARNRSRAWCSMEVCGNRAKVRRYRARAAR